MGLRLIQVEVPLDLTLAVDEGTGVQDVDDHLFLEVGGQAIQATAHVREGVRLGHLGIVVPLEQRSHGAVLRAMQGAEDVEGVRRIHHRHEVGALTGLQDGDDGVLIAVEGRALQQAADELRPTRGGQGSDLVVAHLRDVVADGAVLSPGPQTGEVGGGRHVRAETLGAEPLEVGHVVGVGDIALQLTAGVAVGIWTDQPLVDQRLGALPGVGALGGHVGIEPAGHGQVLQRARHDVGRQMVQIGNVGVHACGGPVEHPAHGHEVRLELADVGAVHLAVVGLVDPGLCSGQVVANVGLHRADQRPDRSVEIAGEDIEGVVPGQSLIAGSLEGRLPVRLYGVAVVGGLGVVFVDLVEVADALEDVGGVVEGGALRLLELALGHVAVDLREPVAVVHRVAAL